MSKYQRMMADLAEKGVTSAKAFGNSMLPIIKSGSLLVWQKQEDYKVGDIVFCKVKGRFIDAHKIKAMDAQKGYLIANQAGYENGWTKKIFGKVVLAKHGTTQAIFK